MWHENQPIYELFWSQTHEEGVKNLALPSCHCQRHKTNTHTENYIVLGTQKHILKSGQVGSVVYQTKPQPKINKKLTKSKKVSTAFT